MALRNDILEKGISSKIRHSKKIDITDVTHYNCVQF